MKGYSGWLGNLCGVQTESANPEAQVTNLEKIASISESDAIIDLPERYVIDPWLAQARIEVIPIRPLFRKVDSRPTLPARCTPRFSLNIDECETVRGRQHDY